MTNPYLIDRRATRLEAVPFRLNGRKWDWAEKLFLELGCPAAAERAASFAAEERMVADRIEGIVPIGAGEDDPEATASAIAFGGPLPRSGEAA